MIRRQIKRCHPLVPLGDDPPSLQSHPLFPLSRLHSPHPHPNYPPLSDSRVSRATVAHKWSKSLDRLDVVREDVESATSDEFHAFLDAAKVWSEALYQDLGVRSLEVADGLGVVRGTVILLVVPAL